MKEDRLEKIEVILLSLAEKTEKNSDAISRLEKQVTKLEVQTERNAEAVEKMQISITKLSLTTSEEHASIRGDIRALDRKIDGTPDEVDKTYGSLLNELTDRMTALEQELRQFKETKTSG